MPITHYKPKLTTKTTSPRSKIALSRLGLTPADITPPNRDDLFAKYRDAETVQKALELHQKLQKKHTDLLAQEYANMTSHGISQEEFIFADRPQSLENLVITSLTLSQLHQKNELYEANTKLSEAKRVQILSNFHEKQKLQLQYLGDAQNEAEARRIAQIKENELARAEKMRENSEKQAQILAQVQRQEASNEQFRVQMIDEFRAKNEKIQAEKELAKVMKQREMQQKWEVQQVQIREAEERAKEAEIERSRVYQSRLQQEKIAMVQREQQKEIEKQLKFESSMKKQQEQDEKMKKLEEMRYQGQLAQEQQLKEKQMRAQAAAERLMKEKQEYLKEKSQVLNSKIDLVNKQKDSVFKDKIGQKQTKLAKTEQIFDKIEQDRKEMSSMLLLNKAQNDLFLEEKFQTAEQEKRKREFQRQLMSIKVKEKQDEIELQNMVKSQLSCQHVQNSVRFASLQEEDKLRMSQLQVKDLQPVKAEKKFPRVEYSSQPTQKLVQMPRPMSASLGSQRGSYQQKQEWKQKIEDIREKHIKVMEKRVLDQQKREVQMVKELSGILTVAERTKILQDHRRERDQMQKEMQQIRYDQIAEMKHMYYILEKRFQGV